MAKRIMVKQPTWVRQSNGSMQAMRQCQVTGEKFIINVSEDQYRQWTGGKLIQNVMPELNADQREILISGYTPAEWNKIFGKE
jgi:hypothetical protein